MSVEIEKKLYMLTERDWNNNIWFDKILFGELSITDFTRESRINQRLYIASLRYGLSKTSDIFIEQLKVLESDIRACKNESDKKDMMHKLDSYLNMMKFNGDDEFEAYKHYIYSTILRGYEEREGDFISLL